jgi:oxygen-dependent protoporphyrinogen oxidase
MNRPADIVIIGGGISGVACAWWLRQMGVSSRLIEAEPRLGGLIASHRQQGWLTERAASMVLNFSPLVADLLGRSRAGRMRCDRLPVGQRFVLRNETLRPVPEKPHQLLLSDLFSMKTRIGLLLEAFRPGPPDEGETVAAFIRRRLGQEVLDIAIAPYVSAVLACDPELADAEAVLPRLKALEHRYGSFTLGILLKKLLPGKRGLPQQAFGFEGGMQTLVEILAEEARSDRQTGQRVEALEPTRQGWRILHRGADGERVTRARQLILATPAPVSAALLRASHPGLSAMLDRIEHAPIAQVHLGFHQSAFTRPLQGNGFLAPAGRRHGLRGSLWISNLQPGRAPSGHVLTSNVIGGAVHRDALEAGDAALADLALYDLRRLCGLRGDPGMLRIDRHATGLPLYHGRYQALCRQITAECRNQGHLQLCANYLGGISVRDRLIQARTVAQQTAAALRQQPGGQPVTLAAAFGVSS